MHEKRRQLERLTLSVPHLKSALLAVLIGVVFLFAETAQANFNNYGGDNCFKGGCHSSAISTATNTGLAFYVAARVNTGTSAELTGPSPYAVSASAGDVVELNFYDNNLMGTGDTSQAFLINLPAPSWLYSPAGENGKGTADSPTGTNFGANWKTSWDAAQSDADGWQFLFTGAAGDPNNVIVETNGTGTAYGAGSTGTTCNDADGASGGDKCDDLDLSLLHGSDIRIQVPGAATPGTYPVTIYGIGHTDAGARAFTSWVVNLNVTGGVTPPDTVISTPTASAVLSGASSNITGTATVGSNPLQDVLVSTDGGSTYPNTATGTASWSWSWTLPAEDYVAHTVMAKARDNQGTPLEDPTPASVAIFVDTVGPSGVANSSPADTTIDVALATSLVEGGAATDNNPAALQYYFELAEDAGFTTGLQNSGWQAGTSWAPTLANNVTYYWRVSARDGALNVTGPTTAWSFTTVAVAIVPPDTTISAPTASAILSGASFSVTGTATAGTNPLQDVLVSTDGGSSYPNTATGTASWSWSWTLPAEDYVAHTVMAKARDNQGSPLEDPTPASVAIFVDTVAPSGASNSAPANAATGISTAASLAEGGAATDNNPAALQYFFELAEDSGFTVGVQNSGWQAGTSWAPALAGGTTYYWHVKARDGAANETAYTATWSFQTAAGCSYSDPTVTILTASKDITTDGGFTDYTVQVTNNDSAACANASYSLSLSDNNGTNFYASALAQTTLANVAPAASAQTSFRVTAKAGQPNSVTNNTDVTSAADANHGAVTSAAVTTTINVSGGGCVAAGSYLNANGDQLISSRR